MNKNIKLCFKIIMTSIKAFFVFAIAFLTWAVLFYFPEYCSGLNDSFCESSVPLIPFAIFGYSILLIILLLPTKKMKSYKLSCGCELKTNDPEGATQYCVHGNKFVKKEVD